MCLLELTLKLLNLNFESANIQISTIDSFLKSLNVRVALVRNGSCFL